MDVGITENPVIGKIRNMFPMLEIIGKEGGILAIQDKREWWAFEHMAPEQQLDNMRRYIEGYFGVRGIKCPNG